MRLKKSATLIINSGLLEQYSWQKSIAYALAYKVTIEKVMDELLVTFQNFIPKNHPLKEQICDVITSTFKEVLGRLFTSNDINL